MCRGKLIVVTIALLTARCAMVYAQTTQPSTPATEGDRAFAILSKYVGGDWKIQAKWSSGEELRAWQTFVWGPGKRFIRSVVYATSPSDGKEYMRYETVYGVRDGKLVGWGFTFDGTMDEAVMHRSGENSLAVDREMASPNGKVARKQTITLTDDNHFTWKVWTERDGQKTQLMDGVWIRSESQH
jgi:hypothetical protein